jgi:protein involved in sex pheromone biosynthesis
MKKIKLTIVCFMVIILLSSCEIFSKDTTNTVLKVDKSWETQQEWIETEDISTWFTNK